MGQFISFKSEINNPWFNPWFILLHTHPNVCATVEGRCLEYLVCITLVETLKPKTYAIKMQLLLVTVREKNGFLTFWYAVFKRNSIVWPKVVITKWSEPLFFTGQKLQDFFLPFSLGNFISFLYGFHFFFFRKYKKKTNTKQNKGN